MSRFLVFILGWLFLCHHLQAGEVKVAVGLALPPYVLSDSNTGMELDIVREALGHKGHTVTPVYLPFLRVAPAVDNGDAEAAMTVNESSGIKSAVYSDTHITYQNVAIGLASKNLSVGSIPDMGNRSIVAFQSATKYLGPAFAEMAKANSRYSEKAKQSIQISLLYSGRTDLVVMDINIYKYYKKLEKRVNTDAKVDIFEVFTPTSYKVAFRSEQLRDDFNAGLKALKASGRYDEIINSYIK